MGPGRSVKVGKHNSTAAMASLLETINRGSKPCSNKGKTQVQVMMWIEVPQVWWRPCKDGGHLGTWEQSGYSTSCHAEEALRMDLTPTEH